MRRIVVNIERLVLKGFRYENRHAIAQGLQEQLSLLLAERGLAKRLGNIGSMQRLQVGPVTIPAEAKPQQIGKATADVIGKGLKR